MGSEGEDVRRLAAPGHAVEVRALFKSYGSTRALRNLDLTLNWGECLVLFGANGAGKTTLIKVLATLAKPDAGSVQVAGFDRGRHSAAIRASVGVLGHQTLLYEDLTPVENLRFYGRLYGIASLKRRIGEALEQVGMARWANQRVRTLSHGMQKRVSLARAILHDPAVLLLDEPESGLDQEALQMLERILQATVSKGRAVLMTTHNLDRGLALAHRVGILSGGRLAYEEKRTAIDAAELRDAFLRATGIAP